MRNKKHFKVETPITHEESIKRKEIIEKVKMLIKIVAWILFSFFGWLNFKDFPVVALLNDEFADIFLKVTLALYYISWILGTSTDLKDEEYTFLVAPAKGKITMWAITIIFALGALFAVLCWADDFRIFSVFLFIFFTGDRLGNLYLVRKVKPDIEKSIKIYTKNKNFTGLLSIQSIDEFLSGKYINRRYGVGIFIVAILILFSFTDIPIKISQLLKMNSPDLVLVFITFLYVIVIESWIWLERFKRKVYLHLLGQINNQYILTAKIIVNESK